MALAIYGYIGLAITLFAGLGWVYYSLGQDRRISRRRLEEFGTGVAAVGPATSGQAAGEAASVSRPSLQQQMVDRLDRWLRGTGPGQRLRQRLARAAVHLSPGQFVLLNGAVIVAGGLLGSLLREDLLSGLVLAVVAAILPSLWLRRLEKRRAQQFTEQLPNTLRVLIGSLRVGSSLVQAIEAVCELTPEPTRGEFLQVAQEVDLGRPLPEALRGLAQRMDSGEVRLMVAAMTISAEVGGNLITVLDSTARIIRERTRLARDIQVLNAQQIMTGNLLMVLPILVGGVLYLLNPDYMRQLFAPGPTLCIPVGALVLMALGYVLVRRILTIEV